MKRQVLVLGLFLISSLIYSQSTVDSLVQIGIQYHDEGQFDKAIESYKTALNIEPNSALINYEISLTYMYMGDYENSILHSDKVIEQNDMYLLQAYITKGSCLDYLGKSAEAIKLFEKGIKKFGDDHLLYYNLGYTYYNLKEYDKAEEALINAINAKSDHASSHLLLGYVMNEKNQKVQSLLCLHYFLFMEPNTERSKTAYNLLLKQFGGNVERDKDKPNQINIFIDPNQSESEFAPAAMMISMLEASKTLEENKDKSEDLMFIENTTSFFKILGELKKKNKGLWWDLYVPLFLEIAESEHIDTYCYFISQSNNIHSQVWMENNSVKIEQFGKWLQEE